MLGYYLLTAPRPMTFDKKWQGRETGEGAHFALPVRDGLLECPNCGGDHFTTLRLSQKNLFNSTLAQPGRTELVLTASPPFICHRSANQQLPPTSAPPTPPGSRNVQCLNNKHKECWLEGTYKYIYIYIVFNFVSFCLKKILYSNKLLFN